MSVLFGMACVQQLALTFVLPLEKQLFENNQFKIGNE